MSHRSGWLWVFLFFILLSGCAPVISENLRKEADPTLTFGAVLQNPNAYRGKTVIWGGDIIEATNKQDGSTLIEVFERPLNWKGEPTGSYSEGRFLVTVDQYLDPYLYRRGRQVTVAGEILGEEMKPLGQMDYRYPLILGKQIYLWPIYDYYPYPYDYGPGWYYNPWWYPYGGYPYWGGFGFGFGYYNYRYHRH